MRFRCADNAPAVAAGVQHIGHGIEAGVACCHDRGHSNQRTNQVVRKEVPVNSASKRATRATDRHKAPPSWAGPNTETRSRPYASHVASAASADAGSPLIRYTVCRLRLVAFAIAMMLALWPSMSCTVASCSRL